ncbi:MAG: GNAT family N-acetyltransferase, partial [Gemmatimonadaceae bacterium]|nr:GNAT family N-acetyltransferase [Gemmatimonadaceae bacterium]
MHTRKATAFDAAEVKELIDSYVQSGLLLARTEEFIVSNAHHFIVAVDDNRRIVGCVHLDEYAPSLAELRSLAVAPNTQGKGVGRTLVDGTERFARSRGYATLFAVSNDDAFFRR